MCRRPRRNQAEDRHGGGELRLGVVKAKKVNFQDPLTAERCRRCGEHLGLQKSVHDRVWKNNVMMSIL